MERIRLKKEAKHFPFGWVAAHFLLSFNDHFTLSKEVTPKKKSMECWFLWRGFNLRSHQVVIVERE